MTASTKRSKARKIFSAMSAVLFGALIFGFGCGDDDNPSGGGGQLVYGSCTNSGDCVNNVLRENCPGIFVPNGVCSGPAVYGSCTVGGNCTNNVLQSNCNGVFAANATCPGGAILPRAPIGVTATRHPNAPEMVNIEWDVVPVATSYNVYRSTDRVGSGYLHGSPTTTSYVSTGNDRNETYYFRVRAVNNAGEGEPSSWVEVGPVVTTPAAPTGVTARRSILTPTTVNVSWNAVSGATSYNIYWSMLNLASSSGNFDGSSTTTSFTSVNNSLMTIYFRVRAVNNAGEGEPSSWVEVPEDW